MQSETPAPRGAGPRTSEALRSALQDERNALAFYEAVMDTHGTVRPFANIVNAERRHAAAIEALMLRYGVEDRIVEPSPIPAVPDSLRKCCDLAACLERENIGMYDRLAEGVTERDILATFRNLQTASRDRHLPAFERASGRGA